LLSEVAHHGHNPGGVRECADRGGQRVRRPDALDLPEVELLPVLGYPRGGGDVVDAPVVPGAPSVLAYARLMCGRHLDVEAAGLEHEIVVFPGVNHAFFNDTGPNHNANAAAQAYDRVLDWFGRFVDRGGQGG
jgi:hypothetical protein